MDEKLTKKIITSVFLGLVLIAVVTSIGQSLQSAQAKLFNYISLATTILFVGYFVFMFVKVWKSFDTQQNKVADKLDSNDSSVFTYKMSAMEMLVRNKYVLIGGFLVLSILIGWIVWDVYRAQNILNSGISVIGLVLSVSYLFTINYKLSIDDKNLYYGVFSLMRKATRSPISLSKVREHYVEHSYNPRTSQLLIRTNMGPYGEMKVSALTQIFRPTLNLDLDPNIRIYVRNKSDADLIIEKIGLIK